MANKRYVVLHNINSGEYIAALASDKRVGSAKWGKPVSEHSSRNAAVRASKVAAKPSAPPSTKPIVDPDKKTGRPRRNRSTPKHAEIVLGEGESNRRPFQPGPEPVPEPPKKIPRPVTTSLEKGTGGHPVLNPSGKLKKTKWWLIQNQKTGSFKSISNKAEIPPDWERYGNSTFGKRKTAMARISDLKDAGLNVLEPKWGATTAADKLKKVAGSASSSLRGVAGTAGRVLGGVAKLAGSPGIIAAEVLSADDPSSDEQVVGTAFPKAWNKITALLKKHGDTRDIRELPKGIEPGTSSRVLKEQLQSYARYATRNLDPEDSKGIPKIVASLTNALGTSTKTQQEKGRKTAAQMKLTRDALNARRSQSRKERAAADTTEFTAPRPPPKPAKTVRGATGFEAVSGETPLLPTTRGGEPVERQGRKDLARSKRLVATKADDVGIGKAIREKEARRVAAGADNAGVEKAGQAGRERVARRTAAETLASGEGPRPKPTVSPLRPGVPSGDDKPGMSNARLAGSLAPGRPSGETPGGLKDIDTYYDVNGNQITKTKFNKLNKSGTYDISIRGEGPYEDSSHQLVKRPPPSKAPRTPLISKQVRDRSGSGHIATPRPRKVDVITPAPVETTAPSDHYKYALAASSRGKDVEFASQEAREDARAGMGHPDPAYLPPRTTAAKSPDRQMAAAPSDKPLPKKRTRPWSVLGEEGTGYEVTTGNNKVKSSPAEIKEARKIEAARRKQVQKDKNLSSYFRGKQQLDDSTIQPRFELGSLGTRAGTSRSRLRDPIPEFSKKKGPGATRTPKAPTPSQKDAISGAIKELREAPGGERKRIRKPDADLGKRGRKYEATDEQEREWEEMHRESEQYARKGGEIKKKKATKAPAKKQYAHSHNARPKNPTINKTSYNY
jgi:hypothetical protein